MGMSTALESLGDRPLQGAEPLEPRFVDSLPAEITDRGREGQLVTAFAEQAISSYAELAPGYTDMRGKVTMSTLDGRLLCIWQDLQYERTVKDPTLAVSALWNKLWHRPPTEPAPSRTVYTVQTSGQSGNPTILKLVLDHAGDEIRVIGEQELFGREDTEPLRAGLNLEEVMIQAGHTLRAGIPIAPSVIEAEKKGRAQGPLDTLTGLDAWHLHQDIMYRATTALEERGAKKAKEVLLEPIIPRLGEGDLSLIRTQVHLADPKRPESLTTTLTTFSPETSPVLGGARRDWPLWVRTSARPHGLQLTRAAVSYFLGASHDTLRRVPLEPEERAAVAATIKDQLWLGHLLVSTK